MTTKFIFHIEVSPSNDPNRTGEFLKNEFFTPSFDVIEGVTFIGEETVKEDEDYEVTWKKYFKKIQGYDIMMRYFWDSSIVIEFHFADHGVLATCDGNKSRGWLFYGDGKYGKYLTTSDWF